MGQSLAVKYRPQTFDEICGQSAVTTILKRQLELGQFKNCYLFYGASGTGKTTSARALAYQINKGIGQPIEIDAASNNSVDNVRAIVSLKQQTMDIPPQGVITISSRALYRRSI